MSDSFQQPNQPPETPKTTRENRAIEAEIADIEAQTDLRKLEAEDKSTQLKADIDLKKSAAKDKSDQLHVEIEHKRDQQLADNQDREARRGVELQLAEEKAKAEMSDQALRTAVEIEERRRGSETTQIERYFFMCMFAVGVIATIALAFVAAGQGGWEYRLSPIAGLLISGGSGLKLGLILRDQGGDNGKTRDFAGKKDDGGTSTDAERLT